MGPESAFIVKYAPHLISFLGTILLIIFVKNYLFRGMVSADQYKEQIERERELIQGTEKITTKLQQIVDQIVRLAEKIDGVTERLRTLELVQSDFLDQLKDLNLQFEKHRKNIPDTTALRQNTP